MTIEDIPANDRVERLAASAGQTVFSYDFPIYAATDLRVTRLRGGLESVLLNGADYTVAGVGEQAGGTITLTAAALAGDVLAIESAMPAGRSAAWEAGGELPEDSLETEFNRLIVQQQQQNALIARGFRVPVTDAPLNQLPPAAQRANRYLAFGPTGQPVAAALTATSVPLVVGWLDIKAAGYIKADGATDDTAGWNAAAATGLPLYYSGGNSIITGQVTLTASGQQILGHPERSIITGVGTFDTFVFTGGAIGQGMTGLRFSSAGKTGGFDWRLDNCFRWEGTDLKHYSTYQAGLFLLGNGHVLRDHLATGFRGPRAWHFYGTNSARAGGADLFIMRAGPDAANPGGIALEIDGNVASVGLWGFYCNGQPAGASVMDHGIKIHNAVGASLKPRFITGENIQIEFPKLEGLRIDSVDDCRLGHVYSSAGFREGVYLGADAEKVSIDEVYVAINGRHGIHIGGRDVSVNGGFVLGNSYAPYADNRGQFDGIHIAGTAVDVVIGSVRSGDNGSLTQRWGVYAAAGATRITVAGCNLAGNVLGGARDDTGLTAGNMDVIACAGIASSFEAESVIGAQVGFRGRVGCTVTAGVITALAILDAGYHYETPPTLFFYDPAFTGSGASATLTVANGKLTGHTGLVGGANYSAGTFPYLRPVASGAAVRALNAALTNAALNLRAQGAGRVQLGNENGLGLEVNANASAVNRLLATGGAAGGEVLLAATGADTDINFALLPKGGGRLRLGGATAGSAGAVATYIEVIVGATTYKIPLHSV